MSADKYLSKFPCKLEAIVSLFNDKFSVNHIEDRSSWDFAIISSLAVASVAMR